MHISTTASEGPRRPAPGAGVLGATEPELPPSDSGSGWRSPGGRWDGVARRALRPLAVLWLRRVQEELDLLPHPVDVPQQHAAGPDPVRILLCGNGPSIGSGVLTHELALSGHLARAVAARTGRGVDLDVVADRGITVETVTRRLHELRLWRYDAVVVTLGTTDAFALLPVRRWRTAMRALMDGLRDASGSTTQLVFVGITPIQRSAFSAGRFGDLADRHAALLNAATERLCAGSPNCVYRPPTCTGTAAAERAPGEQYAQLGASIASSLAPRLDRAGDRASRRPTVRAPDETQLESERQAALDALGVLGGEDQRIDRITRAARDAFGARIAAVALIDHERQWHKSIIGTDVPEVPRAVALGARTMQHAGPLVIEDLAQDPRAPAAVLEHGLRFFAGHPLETPDGFRVGAFCILDLRPRRMTETEMEVLRRFALDVQCELCRTDVPTAAVRTEPRSAAVRHPAHSREPGLPQVAARRDLDHPPFAPTGLRHRDFASWLR